MTKKSRQKFKYLEKTKSLEGEIKSTFNAVFNAVLTLASKNVQGFCQNCNKIHLIMQDFG